MSKRKHFYGMHLFTAQRESTLYQSVATGLVALNVDYVGQLGKQLAVGKGVSVYDEATGRPCALVGEAVDVVFHVGWFMEFAKTQLGLQTLRHVKVVLNAPEMYGNLGVSRGVLRVGKPRHGHKTNCTADLIAHELTHLLARGWGTRLTRAEEEAVCDVLACAYEEFLYETHKVRLLPDLLIGEDRSVTNVVLRNLSKKRMGHGETVHGSHYESLAISAAFADKVKRGETMVEAAKQFLYAFI